MKIKYTLAALAVTTMAANAAVIYDATTGGGLVGSDLPTTTGWSGPTGTGHHPNEYGGIDDGGTLAYKIWDSNQGGDATGNGPIFTYDVEGINPTIDLVNNDWSVSFTGRILPGGTTDIPGGNGGQTNAFVIYNGAGLRFLSWIYEDAAGNIIFTAHDGTTYNAGANDDGYHTFEMRKSSATTADLYFDGSDVGDLNTIGGAGGEQIRLGGGNSSNEGGINVSQINFTVVPEPSSAALIGLGGLALILRRRK